MSKTQRIAQLTERAASLHAIAKQNARSHDWRSRANGRRQSLEAMRLEARAARLQPRVNDTDLPF